MKKRSFIPVLLLSVLSLSMNACAGAPLPFMPREGTVVDMETGMPMEGVVALGVYEREIRTVGGGVAQFVDAKETVTDAEGKFSLPGPNIGNEINVTVYKAGYDYRRIMAWEVPAREGDEYLDPCIPYVDGKPVFYIKKLTMKERADRVVNRPVNVPAARMKMFMQEINKDRIERGLTPFDILEEE